MAVEFLKHPKYDLMVGNNGDIIGKKGYILKPRATKAGYLRVVTYVNGKHTSVLIHRLVAEMFVEGRDIQVNHKDGVKHNNVYTNLEWCTREHNMRHALSSGLLDPSKGAATRKRKGVAVGDKNSNAKLSLHQVNEIRELYSSGYRRKTRPWLLYNISNAMFRNIIRGDNWRTDK